MSPSLTRIQRDWLFKHFRACYGELTVILISPIEGKAVHLELQNSLFDYVLKQPNNYEHN